MNIKKYKEKAITIFKILGLVYKEKPLAAGIRDVLFLVNTAMEMYLITVGGFFIDATGEILLQWNRFDIGEYFTTNSFYYLILGLILWMLINISSKIRSNLMDVINQKVTFAMQTGLVNKISTSNLEDVESVEFRDLLAFVPIFSYVSVMSVYSNFSEFVQNSVRVLASVVILYSTIGITAFIIPVFALAETIWGHMNRKQMRKYDDTQVTRLKKVDYLGFIMTRIQHFPELRVDGTFKKLKKNYSNESGGYITGLLEKLKHFYIDTALFAQVGRILLTGYVVYILAISIVKSLTIGHFKALYDYAVTIYESAYASFNFLSLITNDSEYARKYFDLVEFKGFGDIQHGEVKLPKGVPKLELQNLDFRYPGSDSKVLTDINLIIEPGEKIAIIGEDGAGKSSIIKMLCGLYQIKSGDYVIGGYSIRELDRGQLKKKISVTFEDFVKYNMTVKDNITLAGEKDVIDEKLYKTALEVSGVGEWLKSNKIKDSMMLGKYFSNGLEISPGYWQRIAIARMIYRNREVFIMDEPFTQIDEKSRNVILKNILEFAKEKTVILITQDMSGLNNFDSTYHIVNGKFVKKGVKVVKSKKV